MMSDGVPRLSSLISFAYFVILILCVEHVVTRSNDESLQSAGSVISLTNCTINDFRSVTAVNPKTISAVHCNLKEIPNALFIKYSTAKILDLSDSRIRRLQDYALTGLKNLETLVLARNNITEIKSWSEHNLETVTSIDLRRNAISDITKAFLARYPNLSKLNLAVNIIERLTDGVFRDNAQLKHINLGKNLLTSINDAAFKGLHKLAHLSLHHNRIHAIDPFAFATNTHLKSLRLEGNELKALDNLITTSLPRLTNFNLSHNYLSTIEENTFAKNLDLRCLDLSYNEINNIASEKSFNGLQSLEILNISNNELMAIHSKAFREMTELRHLDVSVNNLTILMDELFVQNINLEHLNISLNALEEIQVNVFMHTQMLQLVDMYGNGLNSDGWMMHLNAGLNYLNISANRYVSINISKVADFGSVELFGNPMNCQWLAVEMFRAPSTIHFGTSYLVASDELMFEVPGIECDDEDGTRRNIVVLQQKPMNGVEEDSSIAQLRHPYTSETYKKLFHDEFDYKSVCLWLILGVAVVFGAVKCGTVFFRRSEQKSEEYRQAQQDCILCENSTYSDKEGFDYHLNDCQASEISV